LFFNEKPTKGYISLISIHLSDIVGCQLSELEDSSNESSNWAFFTIFAYPFIRVVKITGIEMVRTRKVFKLGVNKFKSKEENQSVAEEWIRAILWCSRDPNKVKKGKWSLASDYYPLHNLRCAILK